MLAIISISPDNIVFTKPIAVTTSDGAKKQEPSDQTNQQLSQDKPPVF